jgi:hypothetical protein
MVSFEVPSAFFILQECIHLVDVSAATKAESKHPVYHQECYNSKTAQLKLLPNPFLL